MAKFSYDNCPNCGTPYKKGSEKCWKCGFDLSDTDEVERLKSQKSRTQLDKILLLVSVALACFFFLVPKFTRCSRIVWPSAYNHKTEFRPRPYYRHQSAVRASGYEYVNYDKTLKGEELVVFNEGFDFYETEDDIIYAPIDREFTDEECVRGFTPEMVIALKTAKEEGGYTVHEIYGVLVDYIYVVDTASSVYESYIDILGRMEELSMVEFVDGKSDQE